jgi:hypothetical protein
MVGVFKMNVNQGGVGEFPRIDNGERDGHVRLNEEWPGRWQGLMKRAGLKRRGWLAKVGGGEKRDCPASEGNVCGQRLLQVGGNIPSLAGQALHLNAIA